jgi:hypothetical protein
MNLEDIIQTEVSLSQENKFGMVPFIYMRSLE